MLKLVWDAPCLTPKVEPLAHGTKYLLWPWYVRVLKKTIRAYTRQWLSRGSCVAEYL